MELDSKKEKSRSNSVSTAEHTLDKESETGDVALRRGAISVRRCKINKRPTFGRKTRSQRKCNYELPWVDTDGTPYPEPRERVIVNVGGVKFHTFRSTLLQVPSTRLFYLMKMSPTKLHPDEYQARTNQFFFDRSPQLFESVINYYRTGQLHVPRDVCWPLFDNELQFWGLDQSHLETCCWMIYKQHTDNERTLKMLDAEEDEERRDPRLDVSDKSKVQHLMVELWALMDDPISSRSAKVLALFSLFTILLSVAIFCLETHEVFQMKVHHNVTVLTENGTETWKLRTEREPMAFLFYMETCCVVWFALEFILRFVSCPDKFAFIKKLLNIVDFLSILPYFFDFISDSNQATGLLRVVRVCRVFRVFKLTRHSVGLKILWHTLYASLKELFILGIFMFLGVVIFASLIYYAEKLFEGHYPTDFTDIPKGFWWAIVTMTTLGYGDMVPSTFAGQIVGSLCAVSGLLAVALPVPVIVSNFSLYYSHYQAKIKLPKETIDQLNSKIVDNLESNLDNEDADAGEKTKQAVRQKTMKNFLPNAAHGNDVKLAIGSKHMGFVDPPFDEKRERKRVEETSGFNGTDLEATAADDSYSTDAFDESVGSAVGFFNLNPPSAPVKKKPVLASHVRAASAANSLKARLDFSLIDEEGADDSSSSNEKSLNNSPENNLTQSNV